MLSDRFSWALSVIQPANSDVVLEIGCGTGLLVAQIAPALSQGKLVAVDQSAAMIKATRKRNKLYEEQGLVQFYEQTYTAVSLPQQAFDKIIAFNMSTFWQTPEKILPSIKKQLKPNGHFYLFYQPPFDKTQVLAVKAEEVLRKYQLQVQRVLIEQMKPAPAFCIIAGL